MKKTNVQKRKREASKSKPKAVRVTSGAKRAPVSEGKVLRHFGEPNIRPLGNAGDTIVIHREYISDLLASATAGAFSVFGIPINPGNASMFPWLSSIARNFESYVFKSLKFYFETSAPTSTPGTVLMAVDYDVLDSLPSSKRDLMSYRDAMRSPAWESTTLGCRAEDLHKRKTYYVNEINSIGSNFIEPTTAQDLRLDDVGELLIASSNSTASSALGEIYVEYEIELKTPEYSANDVSGLFSWARFNTSSAFTNSLPFGPVAGYDLQNPTGSPIYDGLPVRYVTPGGNTSRFEIASTGTYLVELRYLVASGLTGINLTTDTSPYNSTVNRFVPFAGGFGMDSFIWVVGNTQPFAVTGALATLTVSLTGATFNTSSFSAIRVVQIPDYEAGASNGSIINLEARSRPLWTMKRKHRKNYPLKLCIESIDDEEEKSFSVLAGDATPSDREKESPVRKGGNRSFDAPPSVVIDGLDARLATVGRVRSSVVKMG